MDIETYLMHFVVDITEPLAARNESKRLLDRWRAGIIPSPRQLKTLRGLAGHSTVMCARLQPGGECMWLARHAEEMGLRKPNMGEKAICRRGAKGKIGTLWKECPGFKRLQ